MSLALAAVLTAASCAQDLPMRGRCTLGSEGLQVVLAGLAACGDEESAIAAAEQALSSHRDLHGWGLGDGFDLVTGDQQAACRAEDLDLLRMMTIPCGEFATSSVHSEIAQCMERNGRVDDAIKILSDDLDASLSRSHQRYDWRASRRSLIAQDAALLDARHGRWQEAFGFAELWEPTSWCGNCADSQSNRIVRFRTKCLIELGRLGESRDSCVEAIQSIWSPMAMTELWIETFVRDELLVDARLAAELLGGFATPWLSDDLEADARCWSVRRLAKHEQLSRLEELCNEHRHSLVPLLLALPESEFERLITPLLDEEISEADLRLVSLLVETGRSALKPVLDKLEPLADGRVEYAKKTWVAVNERRARLAQQ